MRTGTEVINIPDRLRVTVIDHFGGNQYNFRVEETTKKDAFDEGSYSWFNFIGTLDELFKHMAKHVATHNKLVQQFGKGMRY